MSKLRIAADLSLPVEAVTEKLGFLGRTGGGKSYAAQKLAEEMHAAGAQFVALDPVGIWWGLRLAKDGKAAGIAIPVLGGLHGDVPLEPSSGKVVADLVVDKGTSVVVDVSQFESDTDKARFAKDFAARFFFRKKAAPSPVHLYVEEAQEFVPQNPNRDEAHMLHAFHRLIKLGRNFGIGVSLISQRPQEVNKKALNQTELLFAFQMTGPQERKAVQGWIAEKGVDEDIAGELPKLKRGQPHAWSPAWLQISRVVAIGEKWTFDASSTPKVGDGKKVRELAPIDIEQLGAEIKATVEKAKAEDPRELKKEIASLRTQLTKAQKGVATEKPVIDQAVIDRAVNTALASVHTRNKGEATQVRRALAKVNAAAHEIAELLDPAIARLDLAFIEIEGPKSNGTHPVTVARPRIETSRSIRTRPSPAPASSDFDGSVSRPQLRMLQALASFEALGVNELAKSHVGVFSNQSPTSSGLDKNFSTLRTAGLIEYLSESRVRLTDAGRESAGQVDSPASLKDLHRAWFAKISGPQERMLEILIDACPGEIDRDELAKATGQSPTSSGFDKNCSTLRSLGVVDYEPGRRIAAAQLLFPGGLS